MKVTLTIWERVVLAQIIGGRQGTIEQVRLGLAALEVLTLSDTEKLRVGLREATPGQFAWIEDGGEYDLEFPDDVWRLIQMYIGTCQTWPIDVKSPMLCDKILKEVGNEA